MLLLLFQTAGEGVVPVVPVVPGITSDRTLAETISLNRPIGTVTLDRNQGDTTTDRPISNVLSTRSLSGQITKDRAA